MEILEEHVSCNAVIELPMYSEVAKKVTDCHAFTSMNNKQNTIKTTDSASDGL
jgi:hypothetical protein